MEMVLDQVCTSCGNPSRPYGRFCLFCGDVLAEDPAKILETPETGKPTDPVPTEFDSTSYAGFWLRAGAAAIDVSLEVAGALVLTVVIDFLLARLGPLFGISQFGSKVATGMSFILVLSVGSWLYCAFAESSCWRATLGKKLLGLQVVTAEGGKLSFGQATVRHFMKFLSLFILMIGFMMAGWTKRRQALHDIPSDCLVIRVAEQKG